VQARRRILFAALLLLAGGAAAALAAEARSVAGRAARTEQFERLVGGLGFGPATDLSGCAFGFDPRLDPRCGAETGPIPGGACLCPRHAGSVFFYPPPEERSHAPLP
jgi:hypothetical protein